MIKVPFAYTADGKEIHCSVPKTEYENEMLICKHCNSQLVPKQGNILIWHFAHATDHECDGGRGHRESNLHKICKELLAKGIEEGRITRRENWASGKVVTEDRLWMPVYQPDVGLHPTNIHETYTALEIKNTNAKGQDTAKKVHDLEHIMFEVDVTKWHDLVLDYEITKNPDPIYKIFNEIKWKQIKYVLPREYDPLLQNTWKMTWVDIQRMTSDEYMKHAWKALKIQEKAAKEKEYEDAAKQWTIVNEEEMSGEHWQSYIENEALTKRLEEVEQRIRTITDNAKRITDNIEKVQLQIEETEEEKSRIERLINANETKIGDFERRKRKTENAIECERNAEENQYRCRKCEKDFRTEIVSNILYSAVIKQYSDAKVSKFVCRECAE